MVDWSMKSDRKITAALLAPELSLGTSRSGGPGGQNVNKVNSKVTLRFDIPGSRLLTDDEKSLLLTRLASRLTREGILVVSAQDKRSQLQNREDVLRKFDSLLVRAFAKRKPRKATKPTKASREARRTSKKLHSEKKRRRGAPPE